MAQRLVEIIDDCQVTSHDLHSCYGYTPLLSKRREKFLAFRCWADADSFLGEEDRHKLIALARDGSAACRVTRRANALVLLDDGWSCRDVAKAFLLDDDTIPRLAQAL